MCVRCPFAQRAASAFVHDQANLIGRVVLGDHVHIAAGSSVRADEGSPFFIGANSNALFGLKREIKLVDQKQKARWSEANTNPVPEVKK